MQQVASFDTVFLDDDFTKTIENWCFFNHSFS